MRTKINYRINERYIFKKKRDKLLQKQNNRYMYFKELPKSYVELQNRIKALDENFSIIDSKINQKYYKPNLLQKAET